MSESSSLDIARGSLVYVKETGKRRSSFVPPKQGPTDPEAFVKTEHLIRDARSVQPSPTLAENGFQLITHGTALSNADFYANPDGKIEKIYYEEMKNVIKKICPDAVEVVPFHHRIRKASSSPTTSTKNSDDKNVENNRAVIYKPTGLVHCDYTIRSAISKLETNTKLEHRQGRFAIVNVWRNISDDSPIQNDHLAVCDARTIAAPDDFIVCDVIGENYEREVYNLDPKRKEFHQWYYYPNMVKEEVIVFMQYDSDPQSRARYTFHTAVKSPHAKANAPPRESIECRSIVVFPNHQPNTIPQNDALKEEGDLVSVVISKIMEALKYPDMWPKDAQLWMKTELYVTGGVESVVKGIVADGAKEYRLDETTEEQRNEIIQRLLSDGKFEEIAKQYFPAI